MMKVPPSPRRPCYATKSPSSGRLRRPYVVRQDHGTYTAVTVIAVIPSPSGFHVHYQDTTGQAGKCACLMPCTGQSTNPATCGQSLCPAHAAGFIAHDTAFPTARGKFPGFHGIRLFWAFRYRLRHPSFQPGNPLFVVGENASQLLTHGSYALRDALQVMTHVL